MGMTGEFSDIERDRQKRIIKKYSILSTSGVFKCKRKVSHGVLITNVIIILCTVFVVVYFVGQWLNYDVQDNLSVLYGNVNANYTFKPVVTEAVNEIQEEPEKPMILLDGAKKLLEENPDTVGYIKLDGTKIDNVVVQGDDDIYYLDHDFYGKKSQPGTLFIDSRCKVSTRKDSDNLIIYGHNQKDGKMFGQLDLYKWNDTFWLDHHIIQFNTNYEENKYVIIASFVTNELPEHDNGNVFDYYNYIYFNSSFPFETWYKEIMERTMFKTGIDCNEDDEYITLSTCSAEWEPSRHVVIARKIRDGEEISTEQYKWNNKPKYPQIYYDLYGGSWTE